MRCITPLGLTQEEIEILESVVHDLYDMEMQEGIIYIHEVINRDDSLFKNVILASGGDSVVVQRIKYR